jgi:hypothetical protein
LSNFTEETLFGYAITFMKYRPKHKLNSQLYFGHKGNPDPLSKEDELDLRIGLRWKDIYLGEVMHLLKMAETIEYGR